jgi:ADP-heptose:LPS heptosyltransferase
MDLARTIGVVTGNLSPEIHVTKEEREWGQKFLSAQGTLPGERIVVIHTGSGKSAPNWSEDHYFNLIEALITGNALPPLKIFLTAREMSNNFLRKIEVLNDPRIVNASKLLISLRELIRFISVTDLVISNSTATSHLADAIGIPAITLFCRHPLSSVKRWGPGNGTGIVIEVPEDHCAAHCSADKERCDMENGISTEMVLSAIKNILSER